MYGHPVRFNVFQNFCKKDLHFRNISTLIVMFLLTRPRKVDFLFCISRPHLQKTSTFGQFMDILPHLVNLSWPSLFEIEIVSNNFNDEETCSGSLDYFLNKCIWLCSVLFIGLSMSTVRVRRQLLPQTTSSTIMDSKFQSKNLKIAVLS